MSCPFHAHILILLPFFISSMIRWWDTYSIPPVLELVPPFLRKTHGLLGVHTYDHMDLAVASSNEALDRHFPNYKNHTHSYCRIWHWGIETCLFRAMWRDLDFYLSSYYYLLLDRSRQMGRIKYLQKHIYIRNIIQDSSVCPIVSIYLDILTSIPVGRSLEVWLFVLWHYTLWMETHIKWLPFLAFFG